MKEYEANFDFETSKFYVKLKFMFDSGLISKEKYEDIIKEINFLEMLKENLKEVGCCFLEESVIEYYEDEKENKVYSYLYEYGKLFSILIVSKKEVI